MRYEVVTDLSPREALQQAITFFGPGGEGLQLTLKRPGHLVFEGGGGHVAITARQREAATVIDLETREWDTAVQKFMARVSRRRYWWQRWWRLRKKQQRVTRPPSTLPILNPASKDDSNQVRPHVDESQPPGTIPPAEVPRQ